MVYIFDPPFGRGPGLFSPEWGGLDDFNEYYRANKPIPAAYFPQPLIVDEQVRNPPDIFFASSRIIVCSERARMVMERFAADQIEFIPVVVQVEPQIARRSKLASAYYYLNVLARSQRLQWLEMPTSPLPINDDGIQRFGLIDDYAQWKLRQRDPDDPFIWRESWWHLADKEYQGHFEIFIEDILWQAIDAEFPRQLNALRVGA